MIRENQQLLNQFNVFTDAVAAFLAMLVSYWLRFSLFRGIKGLPFNYYVWLGVVAAALTLVVFAVAGLYESFRTVRFHVEAGRVAVLELLVTLIIMETFIAKMRRLKGIRKMILIEEAWKAIASANMASYIKYLYKTVRKFYGEAVVVTQEVDDIIASPIVKESIINNSDCKILLDQRKYMNKFDQIQALLGLTDKEKGQILSINQANDPSRLYKEVWIGLGGTQSAVYATEVSAEEYLAYTTEETEKMEMYALAEKLGGDIEAAIRQLAERRRNKK